MRHISKIWIAIGAVVILAIAVWMLSGGKKQEEISFKEEKVEKASLQNSVTATGTIEAVTSVTVGTQVSGIVDKLYVDYNSTVKKGQIIAELDKTNLISHKARSTTSLPTYADTGLSTRRDSSAPTTTRAHNCHTTKQSNKWPRQRRMCNVRRPTSHTPP